VQVKERVALSVCLAGLGLGLLADVLFQGRPLGVNAAVWAVAFVVALAALIRVGKVPFHQGRRWMAAPLVLFAALLVWHTSPLLQAANLLAVCGAVAIGALRRTERRVAHAHLDDYVAGAATAGAAAIVGAAELMQSEVPWGELGRGLRAPRVAGLARGLALGLPFVLLFGVLFATADAVFEKLLASAVPSLPGRWWLDVFVVVAVAWTSAGLLRDLLANREDDRVVSPRARSPRIGATEVTVALGAVNVLFLAFVLVQLRFLFGGSGLVEQRVGLTYAEYARHGFFELVVVAVLVLPLILGADVVAKGTRRQLRVVRGLAVSLIALVGIVMASALERLWLYQQQFGLTELRVYATGVVLWLAVVFVWLAVTVLRGRRHLFATGAVALGFAATVLLNALDPDALIARTNVTRPQADVSYLASLSDDAVPTLLARLPHLDATLQRPLARALLERSTPHESALSWNLSRSRAASLLDAHRDELQALSR
jgi:hypothetical protein